MPRITDERVLAGKRNRDRDIRKYFDKRWKDGLRTEVIYDEVINKWGLSSGMISKILKQTDEAEANHDNKATKETTLQTTLPFETERQQSDSESTHGS